MIMKGMLRNQVLTYYLLFFFKKKINLFDYIFQVFKKCVNALIFTEWKSRIVVPVTFGLCRALGRYGSIDELLITRLFPIEVTPPAPTSQLVTSKQSFSNFR